ncbi:winged helix-turn-helix domain-containing protein [Pseudoalteromonas phenolica]|uniref:winged helix-turn-helix domain-containing protein n=1 Tax=Pseudoalteromonas phenolica TaxID=161398 RepID=UPI0014861CAE|nr:winged helix-turn-helix domain-containing protein [Pseudoalteromonas phenolica]
MKEVNFTRTVKEVKFAQWTLDPKKQTVTDGEVTRELEPLLYKVLCYLLINNEQIITRQDLIDDVWCQYYVDDNAINRAISELRKLLKSDLFKGTIIKTHYRKGYSLSVDRDIVYFDNEESISSFNSSPITSVQNQSNQLVDKPFLPALVISLVLIFLSTAAYFLYDKSKQEKHIQYTPHKLSDSSTQILSWQKASFSQLRVHPNNNVYAYVSESDGIQGITVQTLEGKVSKQFSFPGSKLTLLGFSTINSDIFYREHTTDNTCDIWRISYSRETPAEKVMECDGDIQSLFEYDNRYLVFDRLGYRDQKNIRAIYTYDKTRKQTLRITAPGETSYGDHLQAIDLANNRIYFTRVLANTVDVLYTDIEGSYTSKLFSNELPVSNLTLVNNNIYFFEYYSQSLYKYDEERELSIKVKQNDSTQLLHNVFTISESQSIALTNASEITVNFHSFNETKEVNPDYEVHLKNAIHLKQLNQYVFLAFFPSTQSSKLSFYDYAGTKQQEVAFDELSFRVKSSLDEQYLFIRHENTVSVFNNKGQLINTLQFQGKVLTIEVMSGARLAVVEQVADENKALIIDVLSDTRKRLPIKDIMWFSCFEEFRCITQNYYSEVRIYDLNKLSYEPQVLKTDTTFPSFTWLEAGLFLTDNEGSKQFDLETFSIKEHLLLPKEERMHNLLTTALVDENHLMYIKNEPLNNAVLLHSLSSE